MAIAALIFFCLRRRKNKKNKTTEVAQRPEMTPAGAAGYGQQPSPQPVSDYYSGVPQQAQQPAYYNQRPKYDQTYAAAPVQPGPYQPYNPNQSPPPPHQASYYSGSPPPQSFSPPPAGYFGANEKSPTTTNTGGMSPPIGEGTVSSMSQTQFALPAQHTDGPSELAGRTSVDSTRHELA